jgi:hypothetical protein
MELKVLKNKKIDDDTTLKVSVSDAGRIFVEFSGTNPKLLVQKSFQNTPEGKEESVKFQKSIKSIEDLKKYFGINKEKNNVTRKSTRTNQNS